ncbi:MAG: SHOCT domain-containing protein [Burkholderiaceae bacterium]|nr:SHOCT domain-containing protein [Burkholderiaceae bacterium]
MKTKLLALSSLSGLAFFTLMQPILALAQTTPQPQPPTIPPYAPWNWPGHGHMWGGGGGWDYGWGGPIMLLGMLIFFILIYLLGRQAGERRHHPHGPGPMHMTGRGPGAEHGWSDPSYSAMKILNERFARGEIQKAEYEDKKSTILAGGHP